jgi:hypothetical protein
MAKPMNRLVAIAWFRSDQWERLRQVSVDAEALPVSYLEWLSAASRRAEELTATGAEVERVDCDVDELAAWCSAKDYRVDVEGRALFAAFKFEQRSRRDPSGAHRFRKDPSGLHRLGKRR